MFEGDSEDTGTDKFPQNIRKPQQKKCLLCSDLQRMTKGQNTEHGILDLDNRE